MSDNAPNVPQLPDSGHGRWSPFEMVKQILPGSKPAARMELDINFAERIAVTLGFISQQQADVAKTLDKLNRLVVAWQNPPSKPEFIILAPGTNDNISMNTEAGERWMLESTISLPADGNPAHTPDTLRFTSGLAGLGGATIPNGSLDWKWPLNTPVHLNIAQTSAANYPTLVICRFRREFRYEDDAWAANNSSK